MLTGNKTFYSTVLLAAVLFSAQTHAQNEVAIGSTTTKSNAILWLNGNGSQGLILPVVTNKTAVANPDKGMIVYDDSDNKVWYRNGTAWIEVGGGSGGGSTANLNLLLQGNTLQLRDGTTVLGTPVSIGGGTQANGSFLVFTGGAWQFATLSGDVTGANGALQVNGIKGKTIATLPASAQALVYDPAANSGNGGWVFQALSGGSGITNVSGTAPVTVTNPTTTPVISLANAGITNALLADNAVTSAKIQDATITGADIANTTITANKLAQSAATTNQVLQWNGTNWVPVTLPTGGTVTQVNSGTGLTGGPITNSGTLGIAAGGVSSTELADNAVTSAKISDGTITGADIANTTITANKIAQSSATTGQVLKWNGTNWVPSADDTGSGSLPTLALNQLVSNDGTANVAVTLSGDGFFSFPGVFNLTDGAVTPQKITDGAVTSAKILDGTITGADIANTTITANKLAQSAATTNQVLQWNGTNWVPVTLPTGGTVTQVNSGTGLTGGPITNSGTLGIAAGGVSSTELADNAVTSAKISDGTITGADIANTTITANKIAQSSATTGQVLKWNGINWVPSADDTGSGSLPTLALNQLVSNDGTANVAVSLSGDGFFSFPGVFNLTDGAVTPQKITDGAVTSAKIFDGTITGVDIANTTITANKLAQSSATNGQVLKWNGTNWAPAADDVGGGAVPTLSNGQILIGDGATNSAAALSGDATLSGGTLTIGNNAITTVKINVNAVDATRLADNAVTSAKILDATITGADIANTTITANKLAQSAASNGQVLKWNGTAWAPAADDNTGVTYTAGAGISISGTVISNTGDTDASDDLTTNSVAAGDVTGTFANLQIASGAVTTTEIADGTISDIDIANVSPGKITQAAATSGQVLKWNGTTWAPAPDDVGGGAVPTLSNGQILIGDGATNSAAALSGDATLSGGTLTIGNSAITTAKINANAVDATKIASDAVTSAKILDGTIVNADIADGTITASKLGQSGATANQVLQWNGTNWVPANVASGTVTSVGLTMPSIFSVAGSPVTTSGTFTATLTSQAAGTVFAAPTGAAGAPSFRTLTSTDIPNLDANKITTGTFSTTQIPSLDASKITTGVLPQSVGGTGRSAWNGLLYGAAGTLVDIGNGTTGQFLKMGSTDPSWQTLSIVDADVNSAAAIAGTKITPAFGTQNISTTGTLSAGTTTVTGLTIGTSVWPANASGVLTNDGTGTLSWGASSGWSLTGNSGTNPATNYLGTADAQDLVFRTSGTERARINATGNFGIGTNNPGVKLDVVGRLRITQAQAEFGLEVANTHASSTSPAGHFWTGGQGPVLNADWAGTVNTEIATFRNWGNIVSTINTDGGATFGGKVTIADGTQGVGKVLTSDANGLAAWATASGSFSSLNRIPKGDGTTLVASQLFDNGTNVGIGTITPTATVNIVTSNRDAFSIENPSISGPAGDLGFWLGKEGTGNNRFELRYIHTADGSANNRASLGMFGTPYTLNLTAAGNVGIGTSTPSHKLQVETTSGRAISATNSDAGAATIRGENASAGVAIYGGATGAGYGGRFLAFDAGGTGILSDGGTYGILARSGGTGGTHYGAYGSSEASGAATNYGVYGRAFGGTTNFAGYFEGDVSVTTKVGVGTAAPTAKVHAVATGGANPDANGVYVVNPTNTAGNDAILSARVAGTASGDPFLSLDVSGESGYSIGIDNSDGNKLKFAHAWDNLATNTRMTLDGATGNLGIGTTTPTQRLDVSGSVNVAGTGVLSFGGVNVLNTQGTPGDIYGNIRVLRNASTSSQDGMYIGYGNTGTTAGHLRFYANNITERMRIDASTGNVGIGAFSTTNKLDVTDGTRSGTHGSNLAFYVTGNLGAASSGIEFRHINGTQGIGFGYNTIYAAGSNATQDLGFSSKGNSNLIFNTNSAERIRIAGNGDVGIGIISAGFKLDVNGSIRLSNTSDASGGNVGVGTGSSSNVKLNVLSNQSFGIYTTQSVGANWALYCIGQSGGNQTWQVASDVRYKKNILTISRSIDLIKRLNGVRYDLKTEEFPNKYFPEKRQIGLIAQNVREVLPEIVTEDQEGYLSVAYSSIIPVLIEAIKDQQAQIEKLTSELDELNKEKVKLKSENGLLESKVQAIENDVDEIKRMLSLKASNE